MDYWANLCWLRHVWGLAHVSDMRQAKLACKERYRVRADDVTKGWEESCPTTRENGLSSRRRKLTLYQQSL
ncbi:hypothetical protein PLICRDRAFT_35051 [Plicaturopsis crispa FD-325 SS-3]|nr:hypothetical protein PLICRDRAFT_35051 [Plicaturopsis crispa FD-325 SS-3]